MTVKKLHLSATNINNIRSYTFNGGYDGGAYTATIECTSHNTSIGEKVEVYFWYDVDAPTVMFSGYVKEIRYKVPNGTYTIVLYDELIRAVDYFIASSNPNNAYKIKNITAEDLVRDILNMAGITNCRCDTTHFTFGVHGEGELNLTGAYDYIHGIADLLAWHVYADNTGKVIFEDRKPYVMPGDTPVYTITDVLEISSYNKNDRDLRNRVVVYGNGVYAESKASSPYLPSGFYRTVVLSSPHIDDYTFAKMACDYNLEKLNKLTEEMTISIEGVPELYPLQVITLNLPYETYVNGDWLIYSINTRIGKGGFVQDLILRK